MIYIILMKVLWGYPDHVMNPLPRRTLSQLFSFGICIGSVLAFSSVVHGKNIQNLKDGNRRFLSGTVNHPHQTAVASKHLVSKQNPHTAIVSCSDSRVTPEIIFDQGLGDLFDIRVAGNVINSDIIASLEYAVLNLGVNNIVVMGHESCGAIHSALELAEHAKKFDGNDLNHVRELISKIKTSTLKAHKAHDSTYREHAIANVKHGVNLIISKSSVIQARFKDGKLDLHGAVYSLAQGKVEFFKHERSHGFEGVH